MWPARCGRQGPAVAAFVVTAAVLSVARIKAPFALLLADRFVPGAGWAEIGVLAVYAAFLAGRLVVTRDTSRIRLAVWNLFSLVFFAQLIIGLAGVDRFLMTGSLHVPVPAVVLAGPIYRFDGFFMPILFGVTIVLVGPAWCSYLCYVGGWDGLAASSRRRAGQLSRGWRAARVIVMIATPLTGLALRLAGVGGLGAALVAVSFGAVGVGVMLTVSRRRGTMVHCTAICPLGLVGNLLGKLSPFRLRISSECTSCGKCIPTCRYGALDSARIRERRPGNTCTLCGDCLGSCDVGALQYRFLGLRPAAARVVFLVLVVSLHAVFLGVARV